jgi:hypothetical protein
MRSVLCPRSARQRASAIAVVVRQRHLCKESPSLRRKHAHDVDLRQTAFTEPREVIQIPSAQIFGEVRHDSVLDARQGTGVEGLNATGMYVGPLDTENPASGLDLARKQIETLFDVKEGTALGQK